MAAPRTPSARQNASEPFRVAIVGSGLAGLSVVLGVHKDCIDPDSLQIDIYDAAAVLSEIGAGITLWPRTVALLRDLGVLDSLDVSPGEEVAFRMRKGDQPEGVDFYDVRFPEGAPLRLLRAELQSRMISRLRKGLNFHLSRRVTGLEQVDDEVLLTFADGSTTTCDLVIGADGVHSTVRGLIVENECLRLKTQGALATEVDALASSAKTQWCGRYAYRGMVDASALPPDHPSLEVPMRYVGADGQVITYPIPSKPVVNVLVMVRQEPIDVPRTTDAPRGEAEAAFVGWEPAVAQLLQAMNTGSPTLSRWALVTVRPPPSYVFGHVVLIGDAAHGMLPYLGAGAGMAIDDGYTIGRLVGNWANEGRRTPLTSILGAYESLRGPLTREMHSRSFASAEALELGGEYEALRDREVRKGTPDLLLLLRKLGESTAEEHMWAAGRCAP
ncbi:FAD/NAD(P)-binding domain-containing protein [Schizophyllum commune H4-8]|uniref:FAD/NAD(P)-binding domain-containing protein n=1 Tax=Schizophyllum commune (strain H4-8 / FGSC 9210) TaxID=578458 RepID=UPI00215E4C9D|nr:FAD/NAD(P)-binding domain-containing protein [Schizophyllum commune H4-8]KAI5894397.1 FAD/NAD(P)-binding domain-containing protein [Schizophyllum commune H4-8]